MQDQIQKLERQLAATRAAWAAGMSPAGMGMVEVMGSDRDDPHAFIGECRQNYPTLFGGEVQAVITAAEIEAMTPAQYEAARKAGKI